MKVVGILRESSEEQAKKDRKGLQDQEEEILEFAAESGMEVVFWETVVESASHWDRPVWESEIEEVIKRYGRGEVGGIIFDRVDRETRNLFASIPILNRALRAGLRVFFAKERFELNPKDPEVERKYLDKAIRAIGYREAISESWQTVHHRRAGKGLHPTNQRLFSFCYNEDENRVLDEAVVPIAQQAVEMFLREKFLSPIIRWLQHDHRIFALNSPSALRRWLQNPALKGETLACGKVIQHQALVSPEVWEEIQSILDHNKGCRAPRRGYLPIPFFCSCGARMRAERHDTRIYLRCRNCCRKPYLRLDRFQAMLSLGTMTYIQEKRPIFGDLQLKAEIRERVIAKLDENTKALNRLKANWGTLLEQKMGWRGPKEILEKKEDSLISQQATLEEEKNRLLYQLTQLPQIEVVDVQQAWDEALRPYEVHFTNPMSSAALEEENRRMVFEGYQPGPPPGGGLEIPHELSIQGAGIPSGWGNHSWDPPEEFRRVVPPRLEDAVWELLKDLRAEAFIDQGRVKLRFQLKVTPRRLNKTSSYIFPC